MCRVKLLRSFVLNVVTSAAYKLLLLSAEMALSFGAHSAHQIIWCHVAKMVLSPLTK